MIKWRSASRRLCKLIGYIVDERSRTQVTRRRLGELVVQITFVSNVFL